MMSSQIIPTTEITAKPEAEQDEFSDSLFDASETKAKETVEPRRISGHYRDFSHVVPDKESQTAMAAKSNSAKEPTFPVKLHSILSNPEFQDIIAWLPHGRCWRILQQKAFEERVIPLYFRHGRYSSFARQVNGWGFRRVTHGSDYNSYYHELFLRGMPHLTHKMRRLTTKDMAKRKEMDDDERAPDFYSLSKEHPLPEMAPTELLPTSSSAPASSMSMAAAVTAAQTVELELALLERRRANFLERISSLSKNNMLIQQQREQSQHRSHFLAAAAANLEQQAAINLGGLQRATSGGGLGMNTSSFANLQRATSGGHAPTALGRFVSGSSAGSKPSSGNLQAATTTSNLQATNIPGGLFGMNDFGSASAAAGTPPSSFPGPLLKSPLLRGVSNESLGFRF